MKKLVSVLGLFLLLSCNNQDKKNYAISPNGDTIAILSINWNNHQNAPGKVVRNLFIELEDYSKIHDSTNPNFSIQLGDSLYTVHGISQSYSREMPNTDFVYAYQFLTKKIVIDTLDGRQMIMISPSKGIDYNLPTNLKTSEIND